MTSFKQRDTELAELHVEYCDARSLPYGTLTEFSRLRKQNDEVVRSDAAKIMLVWQMYRIDTLTMISRLEQLVNLETEL